MEDELPEVGEDGKEVTQKEKKHLYERVEELKRSNASLLAENGVLEQLITHLEPKDPVPHPVGEDPAPHPVGEDPVPHPVGEDPAPHPVGEDPVPHPVGEDPVPHPVGEDPVPHPVGEDPVPHPVGEDPVPHPVGEDPVPHPVGEDPVPHPVGEDPVPHPVGEDPAPHPVGEDPAPHPVGEDPVPHPVGEDLGGVGEGLGGVCETKRMQDNYKASLEEANISLAGIRKVISEFEHEMAKPLSEQKGGMMEADRVLYYFQDKINTKKTQVKNLRLKNKALKSTQSTLLVQQRKVMDDQRKKAALQHQEQIKNVHVLNSYKKKLQSVTCESQQLSSDITKRKKMLVKIKEETLQAEEECLKAEAVNQNLHGKLTEFTVPDISEYIQVKDKNKKLQRSIQTLERKVERDKMTLKTLGKVRNKQEDALAAAKNAEAGAKSGACQPPVKFPDISQPCSSRQSPQ